MIWFDERFDFWQVVCQLCTTKIKGEFPMANVCQRVKTWAPLPKMQGLDFRGKQIWWKISRTDSLPAQHSLPRIRASKTPEARLLRVQMELRRDLESSKGLMRWMCWWPKCCWFVSADVRCQSVLVIGNTQESTWILYIQDTFHCWVMYRSNASFYTS